MKADKPLPEALTLDNILVNFSTDALAREFLEKWLWPEGPVCPRCHSNDPVRVYRMTGKSARPGLCNCKQCRRQFTVTVGTIFEDTHIPLRKWLVAWFLMCSAKKGISSLQLQRTLDLGSYRTALFMTHRIRHAMADSAGNEPLTGTVEVDETFVGGKPRHANNGKGETKYARKGAVVTMVERGGKKRSMVMPRVNGTNIRQAIAKNVCQKADIMTDESPLYRPNMHVPGDQHHSVNHSAKEYFRKEGKRDVHTNTVESSFSLLKRGVIGSFHHISLHHLHRYAAEFDFRWNHRKISDGERTVAGLRQTRGKRLTYRMPASAEQGVDGQVSEGQAPQAE